MKSKQDKMSKLSVSVKLKTVSVKDSSVRTKKNALKRELRWNRLEPSSSQPSKSKWRRERLSLKKGKLVRLSA